jgi:hypothetical protein
LDQGPPLQYTLHLAQRPLFSCQRTILFFTRAAYYTIVRLLVSRDPLEINSGSFPFPPHRDSPSGAVIRQEYSTDEQEKGNKVFRKSQEAAACIIMYDE